MQPIKMSQLQLISHQVSYWIEVVRRWKALTFRPLILVVAVLYIAVLAPGSLTPILGASLLPHTLKPTSARATAKANMSLAAQKPMMPTMMPVVLLLCVSVNAHAFISERDDDLFEFESCVILPHDWRWPL